MKKNFGSKTVPGTSYPVAFRREPESRPGPSRQHVIAAPNNRTEPMQVSSDSESADEAGPMEKGVFIVEKVVGTRMMSNGRREYCLRWKGFPPEQDSWESEENCECWDLIEEFNVAQYEMEKRSILEKKRAKSPVAASGVDDSPPNDPKRLKPTLVPNDSKSGQIYTLIPCKKPILVMKPFLLPIPAANQIAFSWETLGVKMLKTIPQLVRTRIDTKVLPTKITDSQNPGREDDEGCQRYNCEWPDGVSCWLPGKLCCQFFPDIVCAFGLESLPKQLAQYPF